MSTYITFKNGEPVLISDVLIGGDIHFKNQLTGKIYKRQNVAVKRAIISERRKRAINGRTPRKRRRIIRERRPRPMLVIPTINGFYDENGDKKYLIVETGKIYKRYKKALKHAIQEYKKRNG